MKTFEWMVNGLSVHATYDVSDIETIWKPWLAELEKRPGRTIVFLAAPPATGKSTLLLLLEHLSDKVQGLGMDGFHYPNAYLDTHTTTRNGKIISLRSIKGGPETFDVDGLISKIKALKREDVQWPIYDRTIHDVRADQIYVDKKIIIIEGNYLLLDHEPWNKLYPLCDTSVWIGADANALKKRLIQRKIQGGSTEKEAIAFYENSDRYNVDMVLHHSKRADLNLFWEDGRYKKIPF